MKTTIDIPEDALREVMRFTKAKTKKEAVLKVLNDFNRRERMAELVKFSGTCKQMMSLEELKELRAGDLYNEGPKASR